MGIDGAAGAVVVAAPEAVQQVVPGKDFHRLRGQEPEQFLFPFCQAHFLPVDADQVVVDVDEQVGRPYGAGLSSVPGDAAQDGPDPRHDFGGTEGFDQIVVGPCVQAEDLVIVFAAGRNQDNRDQGPPADGAADFEAIQLGHHNIEQDHVDVSFLAPEEGQRLLAVPGDAAGMAFPLGIFDEDIGNLEVVVGNQDFSHMKLLRGTPVKSRKNSVRGSETGAERALLPRFVYNPTYLFP